MVAPETLRWHIGANKEGERRTRVVFTLEGAEYNLALTDPLWEQRLLHLKPGLHGHSGVRIAEDAEIWLTVSLSEPFAAVEGGAEFCYKLVAGVLVVAKMHTTAQDNLSNVDTGKAAQTLSAGRRSKPNTPVTAYAAAPDLAAYPDPFPDHMPPAVIREKRPTVTKPAEQSEPTKTEQKTNQKTEQRTNGNWDNPQDKFLWQWQSARTRQSVSGALIPWSQEEDALLTRLAADGETPEDIAIQIGRPLADVHIHLQTIGK